MPISYLIKIDNVVPPKLKGFSVGRNKLWTDANRNMAGDLRATFIGIFPKLTLRFAQTTSTEMSTLLGMFDQPNFTVTWWDEKADKITSGEYYAGDFEYPIYRLDTEMYDEFTVNLIPFRSLANMSQ